MGDAGWERSRWDSCRRGLFNVQSEGNRVNLSSRGVSAGPHLFRTRPKRTGRVLPCGPWNKASPHHAGISREVL